ncbi:MAG: hypothetical protein QMD85_05210 [Candidatus Aenigmarchaeota archaeon]|nr:hypothetical protein [Candidatus Aenigmarchaeota archaeon]
MAMFMIYSIIFLSIVAMLVSRFYEKYKKQSEALSILFSIYALALYIVAIATNDPIFGVPTEFISLVVIGIPSYVMYKFIRSLWSITQEFPIIKRDIEDIKKNIENFLERENKTKRK